MEDSINLQGRLEINGKKQNQRTHNIVKIAVNMTIYKMHYNHKIIT